MFADRPMQFPFKSFERKVRSVTHLKVRKLRGNWKYCFLIEQANLIKSSVFRHANPSNLRGSLLKITKITFSIFQREHKKQRAAHFSTGASERTDEFFWWFWSLEDVESNCSWRLSHVSSQLAMIWSSRALLSGDKRLPLDTWNQPGLQENVLGKPIFYVWSLADLPQRNPILRRA